MERWELCWSRVAFSDLVVNLSYVARDMKINLLTDDYFWGNATLIRTPTHFTLPPAKQTLLPLC